MTLAALLNQSVTITTVTAGSADAYGNPTTSTTTQTVNGRIDQQVTVERVGDRDTTVTSYRLFLAPGVTIHPADRVVSGGQTYQVDGEPAVLIGATVAHHLEVPLRLVEA